MNTVDVREGKDYLIQGAWRASGGHDWAQSAFGGHPFLE